MHIGIKPPSQATSIDALREIWTIVDEAGFDGCWVFDHFHALGQNPAADVWEGWALLAAMAEATQHVRIGCLVTGNTYRHPGVLAKMAVTVDHLSGGRLDVGLGAGGHHGELGLPVGASAEVLGRFDEACQVLKLLWSERDRVTFPGRHYQLAEAFANPKPMQQPHPPLWLGSSGERGGLRVVARHADVWINASPFGTGFDEIMRLSGVVDRHCGDIGRDPATIRRAVQVRLPTSDSDAVRLVADYAAAGIDEFIIAGYAAGPEAVTAAEAAAKLLPRLRSVSGSPRR
jgi:alkanesulfonate monooxygenase SsuD/methylene tetrahydromethanopterin reductase-like flavin-dependent oxidoreductase (luciferase family)